MTRCPDPCSSQYQLRFGVSRRQQEQGQELEHRLAGEVPHGWGDVPDMTSVVHGEVWYMFMLLTKLYFLILHSQCKHPTNQEKVDYGFIYIWLLQLMQNTGSSF